MYCLHASTLSSALQSAVWHRSGKGSGTKHSLHFPLPALNGWKGARCEMSFHKSVSVTCESRRTQTGCFYGLPLKLSRNLSWLFLTFSCLQQRSDVLQQISFTEHLCSAHCMPSLRTENKDPFSEHPGYASQEIIYTFLGLMGWCLSKPALRPSLASSCSAPRALWVASSHHSFWHRLWY